MDFLKKILLEALTELPEKEHTEETKGVLKKVKAMIAMDALVENGPPSSDDPDILFRIMEAAYLKFLVEDMNIYTVLDQVKEKYPELL